MTPKQGLDPVDALPPTSRKVLESAPDHGRYLVPYTVGRLFFKRGWGDHLGKSSSRTGSGVPTSLFQLNEEGLKAVQLARQRSRAAVEDVTYSAVHEATTGVIGDLLEDYSVDFLIREAEALIVRIQEAGQSDAGARGYRDALVEHRDAQASVSA
jgi:hypothetical protein